MPFVAYCEKEHINKKKPKDIQPNEQNNIFYCQNPKCNCEFIVSALNSNIVRTHFAKLKSSKHIVGCWNNVALSDSGDKDDYDTSDFSPIALLNNIQKTKDKKIVVRNEKTMGYDISSTEIKKEKIRIHTIRQLYSVCVMNDDDEEINNTKVKEIFAGRKTSYLYTKYISGIKLVECSYHSYDAKSNEIRFRFPYAGNNFIIFIHFNSTELFKNFKNQLYDYENPILIYAKWNNNKAEITSDKQIIPL